jgi:nitrate reductase gamma subunit
MDILQILTYLAGIVFVVAFARKVVKYFAMPMHVRWELYPIPHEGKEKAYGGSFFEEVDHWKKERHKDHAAQYAFMVPEILFIRALHEDNRSLWYWSFPFHAGLYLCIGGLVFLALGAILQFLGFSPDKTGLGSFVQALTVILGVCGFALGAVGAIGLFFKRLTDPRLKDFTVPLDYINLIWLAAIFITGFIAWLGDPGFKTSRDFFVSLITFGPSPALNGVQIVNLLLFAAFWVYFPFTHMTHMVSKYFMWDKVKWDDNPNVGDPAIDDKIKKYLAYPVTWSASHIGATPGKNTWADVATANPWAKAKEE